MAKIRSKCMTGAEIQNGQDIQVAETSKSYFEVSVKRSQDDDTHVIVSDVHGSSTVIGASTLVYLLTNIG